MTVREAADLGSATAVAVAGLGASRLDQPEFNDAVEVGEFIGQLSFLLARRTGVLQSIVSDLDAKFAAYADPPGPDATQPEINYRQSARWVLDILQPYREALLDLGASE